VWPIPVAPQWLVDLIRTPQGAKGDPEAAVARNRRTSNGHSGGNEAYGRAALEAECAKLASASPGTRNHTLNAATFSLGQLVAGGVLHESEVRLRLRDAAAACGLLSVRL
jgi:hypothetical protein